MNTSERFSGLLTKKEGDQAVADIIGYFHSARKETIGVIAAEDFLDFFIEKIGKTLYNAALEQARTELHKAIDDIDYRIAELRQQESHT
jgi:uncharacterized protein (DUF2164 family)